VPATVQKTAVQMRAEREGGRPPWPRQVTVHHLTLWFLLGVVAGEGTGISWGIVRERSIYDRDRVRSKAREGWIAVDQALAILTDSHRNDALLLESEIAHLRRPLQEPLVLADLLYRRRRRGRVDRVGRDVATRCLVRAVVVVRGVDIDAIVLEALRIRRPRCTVPEQCVASTDDQTRHDDHEDRQTHFRHLHDIASQTPWYRAIGIPSLFEVHLALRELNLRL